MVNSDYRHCTGINYPVACRD